jgi:uncharacterized membrane protein YhaH (DUF805 family)
MNEFMAVVKNYVGFSGRAGRKEYWMFYLIYILIFIALSIIGSMLPKISLILIVIFSLGMFLPTLAVTMRRLHDTDHSGWWILIGIIPFAGLYLLYLLIIEGTQGANRFGESVVAALPNSV